MQSKYYFDTIKNDLQNGKDKYDIARKLFISFPNYTAIEYEQHSIEFEIKNEISKFFNTPFHTIHACGSSKTGKSLFKHNDFDKKTSDFDIAIISPELYTKYFEISFTTTKGFTDSTPFTRNRRGKVINVKQEFLSYLNIGYFRPDLMPYCTDRSNWFKFFSILSEKYIQYFNGINAGIYLSPTFFEHKQFAALDKSLEFNFEE